MTHTLPAQPRASDMSGRRIEFPDGRFVFVGSHPEYAGDTGIILRSKDAKYTSLRLSPSATEALKTLLLDSAAGIEGAPPTPPTKYTWALVEENPTP